MRNQNEAICKVLAELGWSKSYAIPVANDLNKTYIIKVIYFN